MSAFRHDDSESFLARWSRRKRHQQDAERNVLDEAAAEAADARVEDAASASQEQELPEDLKDFSVEELDAANTDFSRFMRDDVPEDIRRQALRKLWESDDVLANLDGLNDYDEDFTPAGIAAAAKAFLRHAADALRDESASSRGQVESDPTENSGAAGSATPQGLSHDVRSPEEGLSEKPTTVETTGKA